MVSLGSHWGPDHKQYCLLKATIYLSPDGSTCHLCCTYSDADRLPLLLLHTNALQYNVKVIDFLAYPNAICKHIHNSLCLLVQSCIITELSRIVLNIMAMLSLLMVTISVFTPQSWFYGHSYHQMPYRLPVASFWMLVPHWLQPHAQHTGEHYTK